MSNVFCCVAIGDLGAVGRTSLRSILDIPKSHVVVFVDVAGEKWIREFSTSEHYDLSRINFLRISLEDQDLLNKLDCSIEYRSFGNPKFFRLMYFKWIVIKEAMKLFETSPTVIFTDLDVYWARNPVNSLVLFRKSEALFTVQQDVKNKKGDIFLCPGIMAWKTNSKAAEVLEAIRKSHEVMLRTNPIMPDDKALNIWASNPINSKLFSTLDRRKYVIGHRLTYLLLGIGGYGLNKMVAYHANYAVGILDKTRLLRFAETSSWNLVQRFTRAAILLGGKVRGKLR